MAKRGFPLSKQQVKQLAKEFACKASTDKVQSQPSKKWMQFFWRHKKLALRKPPPGQITSVTHTRADSL